MALSGKKLAVSLKPASAEDEAIIASYLPEPDPVSGEVDPALLPDTLPGYLIKLTGELTIEGEVIASGPAQTMGSELYETLGLYSPAHGWHTSVNHPVAGEYRAIGLDLQGISPKQAEALQQNVEQTKAKLESQDEAQLATLTKHDVMGDLIYGTIMSYFALNDVQDEIQAQASNILNYRLPSYGIFSTKLAPLYWFGIPRDVEFSGLSMDVDLMHYQTTDKSNDQAQAINFLQASGSRASAMEHLVPEQMFSTPEAPAQGISAVKALALASAEGQKIWTITQNNLDLALSSIELGADVESEIRNAVNSGKTATTHEAQIVYGGWVGSGYLLIDPETGAGAYKIAGGGNGSNTTSPSNQVVVMASIGVFPESVGKAGSWIDALMVLIDCLRFDLVRALVLGLGAFALLAGYAWVIAYFVRMIMVEVFLFAATSGAVKITGDIFGLIFGMLIGPGIIQKIKC